MLRSLLLWLPRMLRFRQRWRLCGRGLWSRATVLEQVLVGPRSTRLWMLLVSVHLLECLRLKLRWRVAWYRRGGQSWMRWVLPSVLVLVLSRVFEEAHQTSPAPLVRFPLLVPVAKLLLVRLLELLVRRSRVVATVAPVGASWSRRTLPRRCGDRAGRRGRSRGCVRRISRG